MLLPGFDVMITIFCDFPQFSAKKLAFFSKNNVKIKILHNLALFCVKNANFWRKYLKIITLVPGHTARNPFFRRSASALHQEKQNGGFAKKTKIKENYSCSAEAKIFMCGGEQTQKTQQREFRFCEM
jgi:hypothetical protein